MANKLTDAERLQKLNDAQKEAEAALRKAQQRLKQKAAAAAEEYDRQRTHRLCTRGGHLEKYLEEPELFTDEQICRLIDYLFTSNVVKALVRELLKIARGESSGSVEGSIEAAIENVKRKQSGGFSNVIG